MHLNKLSIIYLTLPWDTYVDQNNTQRPWRGWGEFLNSKNCIIPKYFDDVVVGNETLKKKKRKYRHFTSFTLSGWEKKERRNSHFTF